MARLFGRTPGSILAKQANLDGSRPNGARDEVETASILLSDTSRLMASYAIIVDGARRAGIGSDRLPDFLGFDRRSDFVLAGQEELTEAEIETAVESRLASVVGQMGGLSEAVTERLLVAAARVGQHRFAEGVLSNFDHSCGFCGMRPGRELERRGLLIASHIKPWRTSSGFERLDPLNGIAACPSHDAAFDGGLLWVNGGYRIHVALSLSEAARSDVGMGRSFGHPPIGETLHLPPGSTPPSTKYLDWHRQNIAAA
jgi:putative restriction endonuclease